ncbi:Holliday junction ATP-dependent DNA helicase RuvA [Anaerocolumna cellulosilytica]|uniref:Holliday junction branch migration complex subunit RuvA n=1 Tax=Anaerocolumna cellulosilytica TaxID=433286 RepID=A0A6S6R5R9_9FIRM|nr:Holliday junction branch migration protein RuvA [Anaerocolumna cellulosilytica]MBB5197428.1 Holliday junction DNA helicase RuvA [Anaerocolumna cellulosilytica]BCJ95447.1 Holliday junction ATP-dependent DNA helicase RuvA [Anaerocolumna cellulosilytica]
MITYIKGELAEIQEEGIVVEANGLGYEVRMPLSSLEGLPQVGNEVKIYTYLHVREDVVGLFGFLTRDDLTIFKLLITVNGIGPKGALGILSVISPDDLRFAVMSDDVKTIAKAPGIGNKTASKLILELKDKLKLEDAFEHKLSNQLEGQMKFQSVGASTADVRREAMDALVVLGYSGTDAAKVVRKVNVKEGMTAEEVLKLSLKALM